MYTSSSVVTSLSIKSVLFCSQMNVTDPLEIKRHFWFEKNQFYVIIMNSALEKGQYRIKMDFRAWLIDDLAGLYKSTYKRKDGTEKYVMYI